MVILGNYEENKKRLESEAYQKKKAIFDEMLSYHNEKIADIKKAVSDMEDTLNFIAGDRNIVNALQALARAKESAFGVSFSFGIQTINRPKPTLSSDGIRIFYHGFLLTKCGIVYDANMRDFKNVKVDYGFADVVSKVYNVSKCDELAKDYKKLIDVFNEYIKDDFFEMISECKYINEL